MIDVAARRLATPVCRHRHTVVLGLAVLAVGASACTMELGRSKASVVDEPASTRPVDAARPVEATAPATASLPPHTLEPYGDLRPDEQVRVDLLENTIPSVVSIDTVTRREDFFGRGVSVPQGSGTGFLWDDQGHIVTNFHVVQGATAIRVVMHDQRSYLADYVGGSPQHDLAVLRIDAPPDTLRPVTLGDSDGLRVGQSVYAIGNPFGLSATATSGIVSALNRQISGLGEYIIEDVIQIDAAINPGNSGGPLLDSRGRLIGINSQIATAGASLGSIGVGFAVPVNTVRRVVPQLVANGEFTPPRIGIRLADERTNRVVAQRFGVTGLLILGVDPGSGAARAGLRGTEPDVLGDIIVQIDGDAVPTITYLRLILDRHQPGDEVDVRISRDGEIRDVVVTLM